MDKTERLAACDLVRKRFSGRAQLRRDAECDPLALAKLEAALGIATEAEYRRVLLAECRAIVESTTPWGHSPTARVHLEMLRAERAARRTADPLARRRPGYARRKIARRRADEAIAAARFRKATHGHETTIRVVDEGHEGASSGTVTDWPDQLGVRVAKSYRYRVTQSEHTWYVSAAILAPEVRALNDAAPRGVVYLSTTVRVRQGRGTSLTVEHLSPRRALRALREAA